MRLKDEHLAKKRNLESNCEILSQTIFALGKVVAYWMINGACCEKKKSTNKPLIVMFLVIFRVFKSVLLRVGLEDRSSLECLMGLIMNQHSSTEQLEIRPVKTKVF